MDRYLLELDAETKGRLDRLKGDPGEPYSVVINRLIDDFEDEAALTREEVEEIRQALRDLKEGRFVARGLAREEPAPAPEMPRSPAGDPQAVRDMEALFSGMAPPQAPDDPVQLGRDDPDIARYRTIDPDSGDIIDLDPYDRRGRARTPHLDNL